MKQQSPMLRLWELGEGQQGGLKRAVLSAVVGVLFGMLPYFAAAQIILGLLKGEESTQYYLIWCAVALVGFLLRATLYSLALSQSHKATFAILKSIRERVQEKLPRMQLGTIMHTSSGHIKQIIEDQMAVLAGFGKQYEGSVRTTQAMNSAIVEYIGGIEVIKAFNQGKQSYARFSDSVKANASYFYHWMKSCQMPVSLARAISPTTMITILPVGWLLYTGGSLPIETFITTIVLSLGIAGPLLAAMDFVDSLAKVGTIVGSVDAILNGAEQDHGETPAEFQGRDIQLSHVSFGYHADKEVLHDVSLTIPAGTMTAFVGPSGSGKSTIAKLIAGFWDVTSGSITLGGQDLRHIPLKQLYDQVAFVSQDNYLFDESIRENIRMGRPAATDAEVEAVAKAAGCDAFIRSLEHGYGTVVGGGGAHLSGGERQRIAIARAMLKDAPIVVLDEATAYIDPENEAVVQQAVGRLVAGKTVLVIAHRLSTITGADQIVVVNGGRIQDVGTHGELLKNCPLYQEMWRAHMGAKEGEQA